jgi:hypothetical protein
LLCKASTLACTPGSEPFVLISYKIEIALILDGKESDPWKFGSVDNGGFCRFPQLLISVLQISFHSFSCILAQRKPSLCRELILRLKKKK